MRAIPGIIAEVRPAAEILQTLDENGTLDGLPFMPEMLRFCGRRLRVSRRLDKTCSEAAAHGQRMRFFGCEDVVFLEGVRCDGAAHDGCQRACMVFWKEAWLRGPDTGPCADGPSVSALAEPERLPTRSPDGSYVCQSTALLKATQPAPKGRVLRTFAREVIRGTLGVRDALRFTFVPLLMRVKSALGFEVALRGSSTKTPDEALNLAPGEWVRVKSKAEIATTLDRQGRNRGLEFTPVMHECCNREFRVRQRVDRMILEDSGQMREIRNTVILENATCRGVVIIGGCPRNEYHLWREIWLRRVATHKSPGTMEKPGQDGSVQAHRQEADQPKQDGNPASLWGGEKHELRFVLGEFPFYDWEFPALVLQRHHTELPEDLATLQLPLSQLSREAEAAVIPSFTNDSALARLSLNRRYIRYVAERVSHHWIELRGSHEAYLKQLKQKARHELRRKINMLSDHLKQRLTYREFRKPDEMGSFHALALEVSQKTYQEKLLHAGLPSSDRFLQRLQTLATIDLVRAYLLLDDDRPIAYGYCEAQGPALLYVHTGYDPDYRQWSPGIVLLGRMMESLFAEGRFRLLDLDWGEAQWKHYFATNTARGGRILFFRFTVRNLAMVLAHSLTRMASALLVRLLRWVGVKDQLKRFFRARATAATPSQPSNDGE